ncbi:MAG: ImmA/IrrE family metallo-endopeptidase [Magnetococcales bacterium]|nr:ImmA/IrrE family metallo-endopeptidase [Magnetococcales bacterium]
MNLRKIRESLLRFRLETVHQHTGIPLLRLKRIENGDAPDIAEIELLATAYGIPADTLAEDPIQFNPQNGVHLLARSSEFMDWTEYVRYQIVQISNAANDVAKLQAMFANRGYPTPSVADFPPLPAMRSNSSPWEQGRDLAHAFREYYGLGNTPLSSVRDFVLDLNVITLLYCKLGDLGPAGLTFANANQNAVVALNLDGKNSNPTARRVSLAHELCHVWVDWRRPTPLAKISGYPAPRQLEVEQRANAFAIRLLCPETVINNHLDNSRDGLRTAEYLIREFGLPYSAAKNYLQHTCSITITDRPPPTLRAVGIDQRWEAGEQPEGVYNFPLHEVPIERRTSIARYATDLYAEGLIQRDYFAEMLGVSPSLKLESVLDFFNIDLSTKE